MGGVSCAQVRLLCTQRLAEHRLGFCRAAVSRSGLHNRLGWEASRGLCSAGQSAGWACSLPLVKQQSKAQLHDYDVVTTSCSAEGDVLRMIRQYPAEIRDYSGNAERVGRPHLASAWRGLTTPMGTWRGFLCRHFGPPSLLKYLFGHSPPCGGPIYYYSVTAAFWRGVDAKVGKTPDSELAEVRC